MIKIKQNDKAFLIIQLIIAPLSTFFAVVLNRATLIRYQSIYPEYPEQNTLGISTPPNHLIFFHMLGANGIIVLSVLATLAILLITLFGRPKRANIANSILLTISMLFYVGVFVSYTIGMLILTWHLGQP